MEKKTAHRQPVNAPQKHGFVTHRDAIWAKVRELKTNFTTSDIAAKTDVSVSRVRDYLNGLVASGYVEQLEPEAYKATPGAARIHNVFQSFRFNLIRDIGVDAPRVDGKGKTIKQGLAREQMWRTIRIIGQFSIKHLAVQASTDEFQVKENDAKNYILYLKAAGYIRLVQKRRPGQAALYQFIPARYSGPRPPMVQRVNQVFDPNLNKVVWTQEAKR